MKPQPLSGTGKHSSRYFQIIQSCSEQFDEKNILFFNSDPRNELICSSCNLVLPKQTCKTAFSFTVFLVLLFVENMTHSHCMRCHPLADGYISPCAVFAICRRPFVRRDILSSSQRLFASLGRIYHAGLWHVLPVRGRSRTISVMVLFHATARLIQERGPHIDHCHSPRSYQSHWKKGRCFAVLVSHLGKWQQADCISVTLLLEWINLTKRQRADVYTMQLRIRKLWTCKVNHHEVNFC